MSKEKICALGVISLKHDTVYPPWLKPVGNNKENKRIKLTVVHSVYSAVYVWTLLHQTLYILGTFTYIMDNSYSIVFYFLSFSKEVYFSTMKLLIKIFKFNLHISYTNIILEYQKYDFYVDSYI